MMFISCFEKNYYYFIKLFLKLGNNIIKILLNGRIIIKNDINQTIPKSKHIFPETFIER